MQFFSLETCKKLQAAVCGVEPIQDDDVFFKWCYYGDEKEAINWTALACKFRNKFSGPIIIDKNFTHFTYTNISAFTPWHFLAETEQAEDNRKIVWKEIEKEKICTHCGFDTGLRNPSGSCDHLYYPEKCNICLNNLLSIKDRRIKMMFSKDPEQYLKDTWVLK